jgi:hypothetical protein
MSRVEAIDQPLSFWTHTMNLNFPKIIASGLAVAAFAICAQEPMQNINPMRHGNLAAAQSLVRQAFDKLSDAQFANHAELGGHAGRAKELLREANEEIKLAAMTANQR